VATFIDQDQKISETLRYAIILASEETGMVETLVFFEDGWTTVHQHFPANNSSMTETLQAATQSVIERYQIPKANIQVKITGHRPAPGMPSHAQLSCEPVRHAS
jgi:hypothetical protein